MSKKIYWDVVVKDGERYVKEVDVYTVCDHYLKRVKESNEIASLWKEKCEATQKELADAKAECDQLNYVDWEMVANSVLNQPEPKKAKVKVNQPEPKKAKVKVDKEAPPPKVKVKVDKEAPQPKVKVKVDKEAPPPKVKVKVDKEAPLSKSINLSNI
jgi:hypothetical protein